MPFDDDLADRIRDCLDRRKGIAEKRLFGCACFLLDGNVLVGVWRDALVARVGPEEYEEALLEPHVRVFDITGRPMKGWVRVEPEGVEEDEQLHGWIERAWAFVSQLPAAGDRPAGLKPFPLITGVTVPETNEFAPFKLLETDGSYSLMLTEFDAWADAFEEAGHEGGGYGWHGVADAIIRLKAPKLKKKVKFDPEGSMFVAFGSGREAIVQLAGMLKEVMNDPAALNEALAAVNPKLMG